MTDMSQFIAPQSDQLNSDDLIGGPRTIKITRVSASPDSAEQPIAINFEGDDNKPFKPCKSMRRVMVHIWGNDGQSYVGRSMTLYRDPDVKFGGIAVGGIRISHMTDMKSDVTMALTASRASRKPYTVRQLVVQSAPAADPAQVEAMQSAARDVAKNGLEEFRAWWNSADGKEARPHVQPIMAELQATAKEADEAGSDDSDPFGLPSDEELVAAEKAAREAANADIGE